MTYPHGGAGDIWRDPATHKPNKSEIRDWGSAVEQAINQAPAAAVAAVQDQAAQITSDASAAATAAQGAAEAARDAAYTNSDVYDDVSTGRAAVADGEQFTVIDTDGLTAIRYERVDASTETEVARYPTKDGLETRVSRHGRNQIAYADLSNCTVQEVDLSSYGGSFSAPDRAGAPGWTFRRGGGGDFPTLNVVDGQDNEPAQTDRAFKFRMVRSTAGGTTTDIQFYQEHDVPAWLIGVAFFAELTFWYLAPANVTIQALALGGTTTSSLGSPAYYGTETTPIVVDGAWRKASFLIEVTDTTNTKLAVGPRFKAVSSDVDADAYVQGISWTFGKHGRTEYDPSWKEAAGVDAVQVQADATDVAVTALTGRVATLEASASVTDKWVDAYGNAHAVLPSANLVIAGDSQTDAMAENLIAVVSDLIGVDYGIGGETSTQVLSRMRGYEFDDSGITWAAGTVRLRAARAIPPRTVSEAKRTQWEDYAAKIAEPRYVEFFNGDGRIAQSTKRLGASATVSGDTWTSSGHLLSDGDVVHFRDASYPANAYRYKPYFVRDVSGSTFKLSEFDGGAAVSFDAFGGSVEWLGDFYYDWTYDGAADNTVIVHTHAPTDEYVWHVAFGTNDMGAYSSSGAKATLERLQANTQAAVAQIKTRNARFVISGIPGFFLDDGGTWATGGVRHNIMVDYHAWLAATYPDNYLDIYTYLLTQGDGGANDSADIALGYVPRSLRINGTDGHLNSAGSLIWAGKIKEKMIAKNWIAD